MSRLTATIQRRDGRVIPVGPAEPADSIGMDTTLQGTMPGGQTSASLTVARDPNLRDLDPFDELVIRDAGGVEVWSGYGVEYPARDGEGPAVEISASGWSAYLKDNPPPPLVAVNRSYDSWGEASAERKTQRLITDGRPVLNGPSVEWGESQSPNLVLSVEGNTLGDAEAWFDAGAGVTIGRMVGQYASRAVAGAVAVVRAVSNSTGGGAGTGDLITSDNQSGSFDVSPTPGRYGSISFQNYATAATTRTFKLYGFAIYGNHGIPTMASADGIPGVLASDVIAWGLRNTCPMLIPEISPSTFVIPHLVEPDLEDMEALILKVNANEMYDYGCFGRRFIYRPAGTGRTWIVRAADPGVNLTDAGTQGEDIYTRAIVSYGDFGGRSLKAGYPGSGCDTESAALVDTTNNILTQKGRPRTLQLSLSVPSTAERAAQVGQVALEEKARLNLRGEATLTGQAQDSNGVWRPVSQIQSGDQIIFADRSWTARRIVDLNYSEETDTASVSLDSTPARLDAILERMGVINESQNL